MIPKILHYCWFGGNPLPETAKICIESWKRNCPDFEIMEWNEDNFDINSHQFTKESYEVKKWAFVSDYVRLYALINYGGIYLDTDTQIIKPFSNILLNLSAFLSYEDNNYVNVGLVASEKNGRFVNEIFKQYEDVHFLKKNGELNLGFTTPISFSKALKDNNIILNGKKQHINNYVTLFPQEYFCAKSHSKDITLVTYNTYAIHHYDSSWHSEEEKNKAKRRYYLNRFKDSIQSLKHYSSNNELFFILKNMTNLSHIEFLLMPFKTYILKFKRKLLSYLFNNKI